MWTMIIIDDHHDDHHKSVFFTVSWQNIYLSQVDHTIEVTMRQECTRKRKRCEISLLLNQ